MEELGKNEGPGSSRRNAGETERGTSWSWESGEDALSSALDTPRRRAVGGSAGPPAQGDEGDLFMAGSEPPDGPCGGCHPCTPAPCLLRPSRVGTAVQCVCGGPASLAAARRGLGGLGWWAWVEWGLGGQAHYSVSGSLHSTGRVQAMLPRGIPSLPLRAWPVVSQKR